ncbi:MAG: MFS transporter [Proteobacteria bacterium]|nr:MAG: MFS transporter [Pseudomonadota bacterium]PIE19724.1 MAG: MFS transporter [Pseudomonadota bacterium]
MDTLIILGVLVILMTGLSKAAGNPVGHSERFRRRRLFNWLPLGLTYAFLYMGRYNLTVSKNAFGDALMTKQDFGLIFAAGTVTYAFSFLINGPLIDRIGGTKGIIIGAYGSAIMNSALGVLTYLLLNGTIQVNLVAAFSVIYALNMYFQSYGAVSIVKVNANWFHVRERGSFSGIFGMLISLGIYFAFDWGKAVVDATNVVAPKSIGIFQGVLRSLLVGDGVTVNQTWWVFFMPAVVLTLFATLDLLILRDTPAQAGLENFDTADASSGDEDEEFSLVKLLKQILTNKTILIIAAIEFCSGVMRNGVMHWYPIYAKEMEVAETFFFRAHWGLVLAIAGISGGVFAGFISDKVFGSRRGPVAALLYGSMTALTVGMVFVLKADFALGVVVSVMSMAVIGVHGMLSGTATMDFGGRKAAGTAVGVIDGFVYLGTGLQSFSLGFLTSKSWRYWPVFLIPFAVLGTALAIKIWFAFPGPAKGKGSH